MAEGLDHKAVARRLRILRHRAVGGGHGAQMRFVARIDVEYAQWNNLERSYPLARDMALKLVHAFPGVTLDWLYLGRMDGMSSVLQGELLEAEKAVTLEEGDSPSRSSSKASKRKRRA